MQNYKGEINLFESLLNKPSVFVFIRHFNWYVCRDFVKALGEVDLNAYNKGLYIIGLGKYKLLKYY